MKNYSKEICKTLGVTVEKEFSVNESTAKVKIKSDCTCWKLLSGRWVKRDFVLTKLLKGEYTIVKATK